MALPFNYEYPIVRAHNFVQKSRIKQAVEEVFGDQMNTIQQDVAIIKNQGGGGGIGAASPAMSAEMQTLLDRATELLKKVQQLIDGQGGTGNPGELQKAQEKLASTLADLQACGDREKKLTVRLQEMTRMKRMAEAVQRESQDDFDKLVNEDKGSIVTGSNTKFTQTQRNRLQDLANLRAQLNGAKQSGDAEDILIGTLRGEIQTLKDEAVKLSAELAERHTAMEELVSMISDFSEGNKFDETATQISAYMEPYNQFVIAVRTIREQMKKINEDLATLGVDDDHSVQQLLKEKAAVENQIQQLKALVIRLQSRDKSDDGSGYGSSKGSDNNSGSGPQSGTGSGKSRRPANPNIVKFNGKEYDVDPETIKDFAKALEKNTQHQYLYGPLVRQLTPQVANRFSQSTPEQAVFKALFGIAMTENVIVEQRTQLLESEKDRIFHLSAQMKVNLSETDAFMLFKEIRKRVLQNGGDPIPDNSREMRLFFLVVGRYGLFAGVEREQYVRENIIELKVLKRSNIKKKPNSGFDLSNLFVWM